MTGWLRKALPAALALAAGIASAAEPAAKAPALDAWLQSAYGAGARWNGEWTAPGTDDRGAAVKITRSLCLDSGALQDGTRHLAVCGQVDPAGHPTPGTVDLWMLRAAGQAPAPVASRRDIASGSIGAPGEVRLLRLGPDIVAFGVHSGFFNMGSGSDQVSVYVREGERYAEAFDYPAGSSYNGSGKMAECRNAADCERRFGWEIRCTLEVDRSGKVDNGYYPLTVHARGISKGKRVAKAIPAPIRDGKPAPDRARLAAAGCADSEA